MRTVLRWGNRWWTSGTATPLEGGADVLAAHFAESPRPLKVRLIYQPGHLETALVSCPKANRATLAAVLGEEYPALVDPAKAWSHEPILPFKESFTTLLHFEQQPELFALVSELATHGLQVEAAWPLMTWLDALPTEWPGTGYTVAAVDLGCVFGYRRNAQGEQTVRIWTGDAATADFAKWVAALPATDVAEPVLMVGTSPELLNLLDAHHPVTARPGTDWLSLSEALRMEASIARAHPAQLLPPTPFVTPNRVAMAASVALFGLTAWWGGSYGLQLVEVERFRVAEETHAEERAKLVQAQAGERAEIEKLRAALGPERPKRLLAPLLRSLGNSIPRDAVLGSFDLTGDAWSARGFAAAGAFPPTLVTWAQALGAEIPVPASPNGAFVLKGTIRG
ncbi:MAG: hypothetical protein JWM32_1284 [Verrucomicrobia bacterium]|nr:hypothetical protein [Verrucomicrobiota bacterium]